MDGDGRGDVLAGQTIPNVGRGVAVFLSRRGGRFKEPGTSPEIVAIGNNPPWLAAGTFDHGKYPDIAAATGEGGALSILLNRSP